MDDELRPGARFAGCRIDAVAGRGGMGVVYAATEVALGRRVALKVVAPERAAEDDFTERFGREVRLAAAIDHPNVVPVYGAGEQDGCLYLVMRYVDGTDLHALVRERGRLDPRRAAALVAQVAAGLDAAHAAGLVHRDVKPANVLIARPGPGEHVYLTDFGLTVEVASDTRVTTTGQWIGTVDYMAPEQLRAEPLDARTDVYALGGVLFAALTGDPPFRRATAPQTIAAHLDDAPPRPSALAGVDPAFDGVVARAMAKDPADRYPSAGDLARAAVAAARGERITVGERVVARGDAAPDSVRDEALSTQGATRLAATRQGGARTSIATPEAAVPGGGAPGRNGDGEHLSAAGARRAAAAAPKVRRHRSRSGAWAVAALVVLLAAAGALVGIALGGGGRTPAATASLSAGEVRGAAEAFARAYGREDTRALGATLARDVRRAGVDGDQVGRPAVLDVYRRQFKADDIQGYDLGDLQVIPGAAGRAAGAYTVRRAGTDDIKGHVSFGVVREGGAPRIALIATEPG